MGWKTTKDQATTKARMMKDSTLRMWTLPVIMEVAEVAVAEEDEEEEEEEEAAGLVVVAEVVEVVAVSEAALTTDVPDFEFAAASEDSEEDTVEGTAVARRSIIARARCKRLTSCRSTATAVTAVTPPTTTTTVNRVARPPLDEKLAAPIRTTSSASSRAIALAMALTEASAMLARAAAAAATAAAAAAAEAAATAAAVAAATTRAATRWSSKPCRSIILTGSASAAFLRRAALRTAKAVTEPHPEDSFSLHVHLLF